MYTYTYNDSHLRFLASLNDEGHKQVQDGVDEQCHEDGEESLAKYVHQSVLCYVEAHKCVVQVISIQHGEQGVERLIDRRKLQNGNVLDM